MQAQNSQQAEQHDWQSFQKRPSRRRCSLTRHVIPRNLFPIEGGAALDWDSAACNLSSMQANRPTVIKASLAMNCLKEPPFEKVLVLNPRSIASP